MLTVRCNRCDRELAFLERGVKIPRPVAFSWMPRADGPTLRMDLIAGYVNQPKRHRESNLPWYALPSRVVVGREARQDYLAGWERIMGVDLWGSSTHIWLDCWCGHGQEIDGPRLLPRAATSE